MSINTYFYTCGVQHLPVVEVLHEIDFCFEGVDLYLQATREAYLLHGEQLPGTLVQSFEHLRLFLPATHAHDDTKRDVFSRIYGLLGIFSPSSYRKQVMQVEGWKLPSKLCAASP